MIAKDVAEWRRFNQWRPMDTAPTDRGVDLWARLYLATERRPTYRRFYDCHAEGGGWAGLPRDWEPTLWTEPRYDGSAHRLDHTPPRFATDFDHRNDWTLDRMIGRGRSRTMV